MRRRINPSVCSNERLGEATFFLRLCQRARDIRLTSADECPILRIARRNSPGIDSCQRTKLVLGPLTPRPWGVGLFFSGGRQRAGSDGPAEDRIDDRQPGHPRARCGRQHGEPVLSGSPAAVQGLPVLCAVENGDVGRPVSGRAHLPSCSPALVGPGHHSVRMVCENLTPKPPRTDVPNPAGVETAKQLRKAGGCCHPRGCQSRPRLTGFDQRRGILGVGDAQS